MDVIEKYYGRQTFALYSLFVAVPGRKSWPRRVFVAFGILVLFVATVFEVLKIVYKRFQVLGVLQVLPGAVSLAGCLVYLSYVAYTSRKKYTTALSVMQSDLQEERSEDEERIKKQYAKEAKSFTDKYTKIFVTTMFFVPLSGFTPHVLDLLMPLNETRERLLIFEGESVYFLRKHFYVAYSLQSCAIAFICVLVGVTENMTLIFGQHACGMFAIIGHQLKNITKFEENHTSTEINYANVIRSRLQVCIERHQRSLRFASTVADVYDIPLTILLVGTFCTLSISLVQVTNPQLINIKVVIFTIVQVLQFFIISRMGQNLIDKSEELSLHAYSAEWYVCPISVRKLLRMMIQKSSKPCEIIARSMYTLSIENFMSVVRTAMSFFMVLRQAQ